VGYFFIQYNQNTILLPFWTASTYYFLLIQQGRNRYWFLLSLTYSLGMYAKFQMLQIIGVHFLCLLFFLEKRYFKTILLVGIVFLISLVPEAIWLYNNDFITIKYILARSNDGVSIPFIQKLLYSIFLNISSLSFLIPPILISILFFRKELSSYKENLSKKKKSFLICSLFPLIAFFILQVLFGQLPYEWLMPISILVFPGLTLLMRISFKSLSIKKVFLIAIIYHLIFFVVFNTFRYTGKQYLSVNTGNDIAIKADDFIKNKNIEYVSGYNSYYLAAFLYNKPRLARSLANITTKSMALISFAESDNKSTEQSLISQNFNVISHKCTSYETVNKIKNIQIPVCFYLVEKK
jgi:hypothetical protein